MRRAVLTVALLAAVLAVPAHAIGGTYEVVQCDEASGALNTDAQDAEGDAPWTAYAAKDQCRKADNALKVNDVQTAREGAYGLWRYLAPAGTRFTGVEVGARLVKDSGHRPTLFVSDAGEAGLDVISQDGADDSWHSRSWDAAGDAGRAEFGARLRCGPPSGDECGESPAARAWIRNIHLTLNDSTAPAALADGPLLSAGWHSGTESLAVSASDSGSGVSRIEVEANGSTVAERAFDCETIAGTELVRRLRPCASDEVVSFDVDTASGPFHEGANTVDVCVEDFGQGSVNRTCTRRTINVDNSGPGAPRNLRVAGGTGWRHVNDFDVSWDNPDQPQGAQVDGAYYRLIGPDGETVEGPVLVLGGGIDHIDTVTTPGLGDYQLQVWLSDQAGNSSEQQSAAVHLRFDDVAPDPVAATAPPGWLGRRELDAAEQTWNAPSDPPVSGVAGYGVVVDRFPSTNPCESPADPDPSVCGASEMNHSASETSTSLGDLPEGSSYVHIAAVSGSGLRSTSVRHVEIRADRADPQTKLLGAPGGWTNDPPTLVAHATDELSGMQPSPSDDGTPRTAMQVDDGPVLADPDNEVSHTLDEEGDHLVRYWARDLAGNENDGGPMDNEPGTARVRVDLTPPALAFADRQDPADPEVVHVDAGDALAGLGPAQISYRRQGETTWQPLATSPAPGGFEARLPSEELPDGTYEMRAEAADHAGNESATTRRRGGGEMLLELPLKTETVLRAALGSGGDRQTVGYGHPAKAAGRLLDQGGEPIADEPIEVVERFDDGSTADERTRTVETDAGGRFEVPLPPGTSREIEVGYTGSHRYSAADPDRLGLDVSGSARFKTSRRRVPVGRRFRFAGKVKHLGARLPAGGKIVELQVHRPEGWDTVRQAFRTKPDGRWRFPFRFGDFYAEPTRFRFRLKVAGESGWPYRSTVTRSRRVTAIPRG